MMQDLDHPTAEPYPATGVVFLFSFDYCRCCCCRGQVTRVTFSAVFNTRCEVFCGSATDGRWVHVDPLKALVDRYRGNTIHKQHLALVCEPYLFGKMLLR